MAINLELLSGLIKVYGTPIYGAKSASDAGTIGADEYIVVTNGSGSSLQIEGENGATMYIPIRRSVVEAGIAENQIFTIGIFVAERDASGVRDGVAWSVSKGEKKVFAY